MISFIVKWLAKKALNRWILGILVTALLGGGWGWWHTHKQNLREEGMQECVQEINQATVDALETALADERSANAALTASLIAAAAVNQAAIARRSAVEADLKTLQEQMEAQRNEDPEYREWSDTALPDGVADRLREAARSPADSND